MVCSSPLFTFCSFFIFIFSSSLLFSLNVSLFPSSLLSLLLPLPSKFFLWIPPSPLLPSSLLSLPLSFFSSPLSPPSPSSSQFLSWARKSNQNINVRAAFIHVIGDLIQSIGVVIAGYIIWFKVRQ